MTQPRLDVLGLVYFVAVPAWEMVKIGWSSTLPSRLRAISLEFGVELDVIATRHGTRATEREEHFRSAHLWWNGEWFIDCPELREYARSLPEAYPLGRIPYVGKMVSPRHPPRHEGRRTTRTWQPGWS